MQNRCSYECYLVLYIVYICLQKPQLRISKSRSYAKYLTLSHASPLGFHHGENRHIALAQAFKSKKHIATTNLHDNIVVVSALVHCLLCCWFNAANVIDNPGVLILLLLLLLWCGVSIVCLLTHMAQSIKNDLQN